MRYQITERDGKRFIDQDQIFPIYGMSAKWEQDEYVRNTETHEWEPTGKRIPNSIYNTRISLQELSQEELQEWEKNFRENYLGEEGAKMRTQRKRSPIINPEVLSIHVELKYWESWHLTWFTHETPRLGQERSDIVSSFERYVTRHEWYQDYPDEHINQLVANGDIPIKVVLMGAEDRWRWRGKDEDSDYPCSCEECVKAGMYRISH